MEFFCAAAGARMLPNYIQVGGVREDLHDGWKEQLSKILDQVSFDIDEVDRLLTFNEVFVARTRGVGVISSDTVIEYGMLGPILRGSGLAYDVRKAEPYQVYDRLAFDIPTGQKGDCWDRYYVRLEETRQSIRIVRQAMQQIPEGPVQALTRPFGMRVPKGEVYARAENPTGEIGVYLVSDGSDKPYRLKVRPPSFCNLMGLRLMLTDSYVADAIVILGTIDIVLGEVDR
jgi:NADH:ubiquinone oxidoreductase subunit D